jgi:hypothetical protein
MKIVVVLSCLLILFGCDPHVDLENIDTDKLLSVTCFISPQDSMLTAYVFRASRIGSTVKEDSAAVKDALVTISDGNAIDTLLLTFSTHPITGMKMYRYAVRKKNLFVTAGSTYFLKVKTPSGDDVNASCTIPPQSDSPMIVGTQVNDDYNFVIQWSNTPLYKYFILILDAEGSYENPYPGGSGTIDLKPSLAEEIQWPSDKQIANNTYEATMPFAYLADTAILKVSVRNIDEGLYKYFKSYQRYEQWDTNNTGNFIPTFQELPYIYSNIDNGIGIFGGYNDAVTELEL